MLRSLIVRIVGLSTRLAWGVVVAAAILTAFCALLFPYALGLPLQMLPTFLIR